MPVPTGVFVSRETFPFHPPSKDGEETEAPQLTFGWGVEGNMFKNLGWYLFVYKGALDENRKKSVARDAAHRPSQPLRLLPGGKGEPMTRVQVHASLYEYLERLQRESEGEEVTEIVVSAGNRATRMKPSQIREEMNRKTPRTEWQFLPPMPEAS